MTDSPRSTQRRVRVDPLDTDPLAQMEVQYARLSELLSQVVKYRTALWDQLRYLRAGTDPRLIRAAIEQWEHVLRNVKKLAREL